MFRKWVLCRQEVLPGRNSSSLRIRTSYLAGRRERENLLGNSPDSQNATTTTRQYFFPGVMAERGTFLICYLLQLSADGQSSFFGRPLPRPDCLIGRVRSVVCPLESATIKSVVAAALLFRPSIRFVPAAQRSHHSLRGRRAARTLKLKG